MKILTRRGVRELERPSRARDHDPRLVGEAVDAVGCKTRRRRRSPCSGTSLSTRWWEQSWVRWLLGLRTTSTTRRKFTSARTLQYAANGATQVAVQNIRYTPLLATTSPGPGSCWVGGAPIQIDGYSMDVWCSTVYTPTSASRTRVVTFDTCLDGGTAAQCTANPLLEAVVTFDDYPTGSSPPNTAACVVYCGTSMTVNSWVWSP